VDGFARQEYSRIVVGALLVALLAVITELGLGRLERSLISPGLSGQAALPEEPIEVAAR
jgi:osmoprotectant transport system permease protein